MQGNKTVPLTSSEMATLWTSYYNDSMSICVLRHFLNHVQDKEIQSILQQSLQLSEAHVKKIANIMDRERFPIPFAFSDMRWK